MEDRAVQARAGASNADQLGFKFGRNVRHHDRDVILVSDAENMADAMNFGQAARTAVIGMRNSARRRQALEADLELLEKRIHALSPCARRWPRCPGWWCSWLSTICGSTASILLKTIIVCLPCAPSSGHRFLHAPPSARDIEDGSDRPHG